jgi:drug/metabolite transporter (DMT)-like permease
MIGAVWAAGAVCCFSLNDVIIKFLSGGYALHEVVLIRSAVALTVLLSVIVPLSGGLAVLRFRRVKLHLIRGLCVVFNNLCFFLAVAAMPLADAVAIFFVSPLITSVLSVVFLKETVGPRRWAAIGVGLVGVLVVLRPGTQAFQAAALLPLAAAVGYSMLSILTRRIGTVDSAPSLAFSVQVTFLVTSAAFGLALGHGQFEGMGHPSLEFLFRAWIMPSGWDLGLMALLGIVNAIGGYAISQAYRVSEAALVAPFEYVAMPLAVFWGFMVFGDLPDPVAWGGIALILASGLFLIWREAGLRRRTVVRR